MMNLRPEPSNCHVIMENDYPHSVFIGSTVEAEKHLEKIKKEFDDKREKQITETIHRLPDRLIYHYTEPPTIYIWMREVPLTSVSTGFSNSITR